MKTLITALIAALALVLGSNAPASSSNRCSATSPFQIGQTLVFAEDEKEKKKKEGEEEEPDCE